MAALIRRVDRGNAEEFQRLLDTGIEPEDQSLILNFEHLSFIGSTGLRISVIMAKEFSKSDKQFGICILFAPAREVITIKRIQGLREKSLSLLPSVF